MANGKLTPGKLHTLLNGPGGAPPANTPLASVDHSNLYVAIGVTMGLTLFTSTVSAAVRIFTKLYIMKSFETEDYVLLIGWLAQIGERIPVLLSVTAGVGKHVWDIPLKSLIDIKYYVNCTTIIYTQSIAVIKIAILMQLRRIFVPERWVNPKLYWIIYGLMSIIVAFYLVMGVFAVIECVPREKIWNPFYQGGGFCFSTEVIFQATGIFNVLSDIAILTLPIPSIWSLQMKIKRKIRVTAIFAAGICACIASVLRTYYSWLVPGSPDYSWTVCFMGFWSSAELAIGIQICCLPAHPRFFSFIGPKIRKAFPCLQQRKVPVAKDVPVPCDVENQKREVEVKKPNAGRWTNELGVFDSHVTSQIRSTTLKSVVVEQIGIENRCDVDSIGQPREVPLPTKEAELEDER